jgi:ferredoxin
VCLSEAPEVFAVIDQDDGYPQVRVLLENPPRELHEKVMKAAKYCPNNVITVLED